MVRRSDVPKFGTLEGVKVVHASLSVAGPFTAQILGEFGADVIWIENPNGPDAARGMGGTGVKQDRRNQRNIALNINTPEGTEVFLKIIKDTDIFVEASKGGQYAKWGLTDEVLWKVNPKLVIVHISGFGQTGLQEYISRPSFDPIAQAFAGYMSLNGYPDRPPIPAFPVVADYFTALFASTSALAAFHKAQQTGIGESIDVAQYEVLLRVSACNAMNYFMQGIVSRPEGNHSAMVAGWGSYPCQDGKDLYIVLLAPGVVKAAVTLLGLEYGSEMFPNMMGLILANTPAGDLIEQKIKEFCASKPALEVSKIFNENNVPCSVIYDFEMGLNDPQYQAREAFTSWEDIDGKTVKGVNVFPKFKNSPAKVWRGGPRHGEDTEDILLDLGLGQEDIQKLLDTKTIVKR